jgi:hypothetical protein
LLATSDNVASDLKERKFSTENETIHVKREVITDECGFLVFSRDEMGI